VRAEVDQDFPGGLAAGRLPELRLLIGVFWRAVQDAHGDARRGVSADDRQEARRWLYDEEYDQWLRGQAWPCCVSRLAEELEIDVNFLRKAVRARGMAGQLGHMQLGGRGLSKSVRVAETAVDK
jgi:hypothetical protein